MLALSIAITIESVPSFPNLRAVSPKKLGSSRTRRFAIFISFSRNYKNASRNDRFQQIESYVFLRRSVTGNIGWYVVSEKWHHFWELPLTNLLGLLEVAGKNSIFPILRNSNRSPF